jgi:polyisoprenoid-binding protein YceI
MSSKLALGIISVALFAGSCEDPAANKVRAVTGNASTPATVSNSTATAPAKGETLAITPENSKVLFTGSKVTGRHEGGFSRFTGSIELVNGKPEDSTVRVEIETTSVFTDTDGLTKHLQTGDFFEVEKFPKASFTSTNIVADGGKGVNSYTVTGDLDLHGVGKSITFPATIAVSPEAVSVGSEFSINRKDFGILYAGKADDLIRDDVAIRLDLNAPRRR